MDTPIAVGDIVAEKYAVQRIIAAGGTAIVVEAKHEVLLERCAIKVLLPAALEVPLSRERFFREAQALARLKSDYVVRVFDVGELGDGTPYMVMEYLEGTDLEGLLLRRGALPLAEVALYVLQVCAALAEVHALGIVHRDLKPANIALTRAADGTPRIKLIDFGISKVTLRPDGVDAWTTMDGAIMGTPFFMAPEQIRGGNAGTATDIWAVGVLLYHLLTARLPFGDDTPVRTLARVLVDPPTPPSKHDPRIPREIERLILRCLEKRPAHRPATVMEIADALAPFAIDGAPISRQVRQVHESIRAPAAPPSSPAAKIPTLDAHEMSGRARSTSRPRWIAPVVIAVAAVAVAVPSFAMWTRAVAPRPRAAAIGPSMNATQHAPIEATSAPPPPPTVAGDPPKGAEREAEPQPAPSPEAPREPGRAGAAPRSHPVTGASSSSRQEPDAHPNRPPSPRPASSGPSAGFDIGSRY